MRWMIVYRIRQARLKIACWIFGRGWGGIVMRLWLIRDRAMAAVTPEGGVILAECKALSDALYEPIPGHWQITIARIYPPATPVGSSDNSETGDSK